MKGNASASTRFLFKKFKLKSDKFLFQFKIDGIRNIK